MDNHLCHSQVNPGIILSLSILSYLMRAALTVIDIALNTGFYSALMEIVDTFVFVLKHVTCTPLIQWICKDREMETGIPDFDEFTVSGFSASKKYFRILQKLQAATESGWDKKQTDEVMLLLKCFIPNSGELQKIMGALKAAKKDGNVEALKEIQNIPFNEQHVSETKKSNGCKKWDCPCGSGKKVFTCFFASAKSSYKWKNMAKKLDENATVCTPGSTVTFQQRKEQLKEEVRTLVSEKDAVLARVQQQFSDPKLANEYIRYVLLASCVYFTCGCIRSQMAVSRD